jgi:hypothetical protein
MRRFIAAVLAVAAIAVGEPVDAAKPGDDCGRWLTCYTWHYNVEDVIVDEQHTQRPPYTQGQVVSFVWDTNFNLSGAYVLTAWIQCHAYNGASLYYDTIVDPGPTVVFALGPDAPLWGPELNATCQSGLLRQRFRGSFLIESLFVEQLDCPIPIGWESPYLEACLFPGAPSV